VTNLAASLLLLPHQTAILLLLMGMDGLMWFPTDLAGRLLKGRVGGDGRREVGGAEGWGGGGGAVPPVERGVEWGSGGCGAAAASIAMEGAGTRERHGSYSGRTVSCCHDFFAFVGCLFSR
jgi:hypothetical protein